MEPLPFIPEPAKPVQNNTPSSVKKSSKENSGEEFSPMLDKAVNNQEEKVSSPDQDPQHTETTAENNVKNNSTETETEGSAKAIVEEHSNSRSIVPGTFVSQIHATKQQTENQPVPVTQQPSVNPHAELSAASNAKFSVDPVTDLSVTPVIMPEQANSVSPPSTSATLLMQQIQQILDEGKNEGAIVIKGSTEVVLNSKESAQHLQTLSNPVLDASEEVLIQAKQTGQLQVLGEDKPKTAVPQSTNTETSRQNVTEQFFNAKFGESDKKQNENSQQQSEQRSGEGQNKNTLQQTVAGSTSNVLSTETTMTETSFGQQMGTITSSANSTITTPVSVEGKYTPGAMIPVPEDKMVDTLIQRFNINPRLQTSKLTMQLHPVELGALKVDITVKENSISANIVAGSQQVLETLEKNLARLRTVLEDQGFTIESFTISTKTNDGDGQQLFQEQFDSETQEYFTGKEPSKHESDVFDNLLEDQDLSIYSSDSSKGINLTA